MSKIVLSVDDGCVSDLRIADLCQKYEIDVVFYWTVEWRSLANSKGYEPLSFAEAYSIAQQFEIGSHTITHPHLTKISEEAAKVEIAESRLMLEALFNKKIAKFCPPRGYTNEALTKFTLDNYKSQRLTKGEGLVHIHPWSGANGNKHWLECVNGETKEIWGHSYDFDRYNLWDELEAYLNGACV